MDAVLSIEGKVTDEENIQIMQVFNFIQRFLCLGGMMANHAPAAIANEFSDMTDKFLSQKKLQKLTYIAHGWHLAIDGTPLVSDEAEAWDNGPVFRSIWNLIRHFSRGSDGSIRDANNSPIREKLDEFEKKLIDYVWRRYGRYTANELSDMTHQPNTPWTKAYFNLGRDSTIDNASVKEHFLELANVAEQSQ